jgi:hypothetical protein
MAGHVKNKWMKSSLAGTPRPALIQKQHLASIKTLLSFLYLAANLGPIASELLANWNKKTLKLFGKKLWFHAELSRLLTSGSGSSQSIKPKNVLVVLNSLIDFSLSQASKKLRNNFERRFLW